MAARNPYPALVIGALIPLIGLLAVWRWADGHVAGPVSEPSVAESTAPPATLVTPLLSARRAPHVLVGEQNEQKFAAALKPVVNMIGSGSCIAVSVDGAAVASANATAALRPASTVKLITAAVAVDVLGVDFRYTTTAAGSVANGVVNGDLYLIGGGDPVLSEPWWKTATVMLLPPTVITDITELADSIKAAGITQITGSVVGDGSRYDNERYAPTVTQDVKAAMEALPVSALVVNDLRLSSTQVANDPESGAAQVLTRLLNERGISIGGKAKAGTTPANTPTIATVQSAPFNQVVAEMLTTSDNLSAEMILKEIGLASAKQGTREAGLNVVRERLGAWGVDLASTTLVDGSGLSDENRTSCAALLAVLQHGTADDAVGAGLPVAGDASGTLADAFTDSPMKGVLRAKTGTLNNNDGVPNKPGSKALAGYVPQTGGSQIEFVILMNGETITNKTEYRPTWDRFAEVVASYPYGVTAASVGVR